MLDLFDDSVVSVDTERDQGFLNGMGIIDEYDPSGNGKEPATGNYSGGEYVVACHQPTNGAVDGGKAAMETCLAANPDINVVYTINEPAAPGRLRRGRGRRRRRRCHHRIGRRRVRSRSPPGR